MNNSETQNGNAAVNLTNRLRLERALYEAGIENVASIMRLTITGVLDKEDFKYIRKKMGKTLRELDISGALFEGNKLRNGALAYCAALTSVAIPETIVEIGDGALSNCTGLKSFHIPEAVAKIGELAFWGCTGLTSITIPNAVTTIEFRAFNSCANLTSVVIPNSVVKIGGSAFGKCTNLASVVIPNSVVEIGNGAFAHCINLASIAIPESVAKIGEWVFEGCTVYVALHPDNPCYTSKNGELLKKEILAQ